MAKRITALIPGALRLDRTSAVTLRRQIFDQIRIAIVDGTLRPGTRLPSTRDIACELRLSRKCVVTAFEYLAAQGLIESRAGAGTRVAANVSGRARTTAVRASEAARPERIRRIVTDVSSGLVGPFRPGVPALDLFPTRTWRNLIAQRWRDAAPSQLAYSDGRGQKSLREAIAAHLGLSRGIRCDPEQIIIVSGARQAIDLTARLLIEPGDRVCVEDPGYTAARAALSASGATVIGGAVDANGLDVARAEAACPSPRLIYVTPAHQYPTGAVLSTERRALLTSWASRAGAFILEDDYGGEFQYGDHNVLPIAATDETGSVIYIGTFSQSLAPALRAGFLVVPPDLIDAFNVAQSITGHAPSPIEQLALADFIGRSHLAKHLRVLRTAYRERQGELLRSIARLGQFARVGGNEAGTHVVGYLEDSADAVAVSRAAARLGVEAPTLSAHAYNATCPPALMLGYGSTPREMIRRGVSILARALRSSR